MTNASVKTTFSVLFAAAIATALYMGVFAMVAHADDFEPYYNDFEPYSNSFEPYSNNFEPYGCDYCGNNFEPYGNNFEPYYNDFEPYTNDFEPYGNDFEAYSYDQCDYCTYQDGVGYSNQSYPQQSYSQQSYPRTQSYPSYPQMQSFSAPRTQYSNPISYPTPVYYPAPVQQQQQQQQQQQAAPIHNTSNTTTTTTNTENTCTATNTCNTTSNFANYVTIDHSINNSGNTTITNSGNTTVSGNVINTLVPAAAAAPAPIHITNTNTNINTAPVTPVVQTPPVYYPIQYTFPTYTQPTYVAPTYTRPYCTISVSGNYLSWSSSGATSAWISNIGSVSVSGSRMISSNYATTYTLTVTGVGGSNTCSTYVSAYTPTYVAPSVSLSQIPYTGFDFGPLGNALYWLALLSFAAAGAYLMVYYMPRLAILKNGISASSFSNSILSAPAKIVEATAHQIDAAIAPIADMSGTKDTMSLVHSVNGQAPRIVVSRI